MSKLIILCTSYGEIPSTLYLAKQNYPDNSITIASANKPELFKFFQLVNERVFHNNINVIFLEPYDSGNAARKGIITKAFYLVPDIIKERRYLKDIFNRYFAELEGCEVFFHGRPIGGNLFYLLKRLSWRNKLVYIPFYDSPQARQVRTYIPTNIADLAYFIIRKLTYGFDLALAEQPYKKGFPYMSDKFVEKRVDRIIDWEERNEMMKGFDLSQFTILNVNNYSVIYFDTPLLVEAGRVADGDTYRRELTAIFDILSKYFSKEEIALKYHPNHPIDKTMARFGDVLPDFIPAELLYNDNIKIYLGLFSSSLINVEKGLAISIANLISFKDAKFAELRKEKSIQSSHSEILFPKSLEELERILVNIAGG